MSVELKRSTSAPKVLGAFESTNPKVIILELEGSKEDHFVSEKHFDYQGQPQFLNPDDTLKTDFQINPQTRWITKKVEFDTNSIKRK
jgi:hypothetical protein